MAKGIRHDLDLNMDPQTVRENYPLFTGVHTMQESVPSISLIPLPVAQRSLPKCETIQEGFRLMYEFAIKNGSFAANMDPEDRSRIAAKLVEWGV